MSAAPLEEFVHRLLRTIERFAADAAVERAFVEVELMDGTRFPLDAVHPEPGFGFVTLVPHPESEADVPERMIVPVGLLKRIELSRAEEQRGRFGFTPPPD
jgi:hypothetical protein